MKLVKRLGLIVTLVAVLSLGLVSGARAQGMTCTLAASDCTLITTAASNLSKETSFTHTTEFTLTVKNDTTNISAQANVTGQFALASGANPASLMADPTGLQFSATVTASGTGVGMDKPVNAGVIIVGGVLYGSNDGGKTWMGAKLSDLQGAMMSGMNSGSGAAGGFSPTQAMALAQDPAIMAGLMAIPNIPGFITQTKTANAPTLDGQTMAEFQEALDISALLNSKDIYPLITAVAKATGSTNVPTDAQLGQYLPMGAMILKNTTIKITSWIGTTDSMFHAIGLDVVSSVDPTIMGGTGAPTMVNLHFLLKLTKVGDAVTLTAPANAVMSGPGGGSAPAAAPTATPS